MVDIVQTLGGKSALTGTASRPADGTYKYPYMVMSNQFTINGSVLGVPSTAQASTLYYSDDDYFGHPQTRATTYFLMTRMDLLRTAEAIMKDYKNNTCVGQYLKEVQSKARYWHRPSKSGLSVTTREYGAMFYFGYDGMNERNIFGTVGGNGQNMMIDMDNSRIIVTNSAATGWSQKKFIHEVIKSGKLPK